MKASEFDHKFERGEDVIADLEMDKARRPRTECPRQGWAEAAEKMASRGDDSLLDEPAPTQFDENDWQG